MNIVLYKKFKGEFLFLFVKYPGKKDLQLILFETISEGCYFVEEFKRSELMKEACLVFDVLHHLKFVTVFDQSYQILYQKVEPKTYSSDEDGIECEDLPGLVAWIISETESLKSSKDFKITAINFTSYVGALVHLDSNHQPLMPVYDIRRNLGYKINKSIDQALENYPGWRTDLQVAENSFQTIGFQLLWLKNTKPDLFIRIKKSLSIAQYLQSIFSKQYFHDYSTIGCHSACWSFEKQEFHPWLKEQGLNSILLPVKNSNETILADGIHVGAGMYSKIAELQTFMAIEKDQFILLSTGAWTACLNPYNSGLVHENNLTNNCFSLLNSDGRIVRMARLFSGNEHTRQIQHLARHFGLDETYCLNIKFDYRIVKKLRQTIDQVRPQSTELGSMLDSPFMERNLNSFNCIEDAYHQFVMDLVAQQIASIRLTIDHQISRKIYIEGGLAKNEVFMSLLSEAFFDRIIYKVNFRNTASIGAAISIASSWNPRPISAETLEVEAL